MQVRHDLADDRGPQMPGVERLGDVRTRVLDHEMLAGARQVGAVRGLGLEVRPGVDLAEHELGERRLVQLDRDKRPLRLDRRQVRIRLEL